MSDLNTKRFKEFKLGLESGERTEIPSLCGELKNGSTKKKRTFVHFCYIQRCWIGKARERRTKNAKWPT